MIECTSMKVAIFSTHRFEKGFIESENKQFNHSLVFFESRLTIETANLAKGFPCVCAFVNDRLNEQVLKILVENGTRLIALRSAGFNNVDLEAAHRLNVRVVRVPEYSPHAVAEHTVAMMLTLNRKIHRSYNRIREGNFSLDGLVGFDLYKKVVGIVGTGRIGTVVAQIMSGFGCEVLAYDRNFNPDLQKLGVHYVDLQEILHRSDILTLHIPLTPETHHIINESALSMAKPGVMLINTGRGALIDTKALIRFLKSGHIGYAGLDVYEEEEGIFFSDLSDKILQDDTLARLMTFPNVLLTSHQAFLTMEALTSIARTTLDNIHKAEVGREISNEVSAKTHVRKD